MSQSKATSNKNKLIKKDPPSPPSSSQSLFSTLDTSATESNILSGNKVGGSRLSVSSVAKQLKQTNVNTTPTTTPPTTPPLASTTVKTPLYKPIKPIIVSQSTPTPAEKIENSNKFGIKKTSPPLNSISTPTSGVAMSSSTPTLPSTLSRFKQNGIGTGNNIGGSSSASSSPTLASTTPSPFFKKPAPPSSSPTSLSTGELPNLNNNKRPQPPTPISLINKQSDSSGSESGSSSLSSSTSSSPSLVGVVSSGQSAFNGNNNYNSKTTTTSTPPPIFSRQNTQSPTLFSISSSASPPLKSTCNSPVITSANNSPTIKPMAKKPALPPRNELQSSSGVMVVPKLKPTVTNNKSSEAQRLYLKKVISDDEEKSSSSDEEDPTTTKPPVPTPTTISKPTVKQAPTTTVKPTTTTTTTTTSTTPTTSTTTTSTSTSSTKKEKDPKHDMIQRNYLVQELLSTEKKYVNNLNRIITIFLMPLRNRSTSKDKILNMEEINQIFSNIETIFNIHKTFLVDFESRIEKWNDTEKIGDVFIKMSPYLNSYKIYSNSYNGSMLTIRSLMKSSPAFATFLQKCLEKPASKGLNLSSYLIMPIQRIPRYRLLLESIIKYTPELHCDYIDLVGGNQEISKSAIEIDEKLAQYQIAHKVLDIQNSLNGLDEDIVTPTRHFIKEGDLKKISDRVVNTRHFFLFNDMLIYCKKWTKHMYRFKASFPLLSCWVKDIPDTQRFNNLFQIISTKKTYFLSAPSIEEKHIWMKLLNEVIDKMVAQNPECLPLRESLYERRGSMSPSELFNTLEKSLPIGSENINNSDNSNYNGHLSLSSSLNSGHASLNLSGGALSGINGNNNLNSSGISNNSNGGDKLSNNSGGNSKEDLKTKSIWLKDQMTKACMLCTTSFTLTRRRHHCRKCGKIFCNDCCPVQDLSQYQVGKKVRFCLTCFEELTVQLSVMSTMDEIRIEDNDNSSNSNSLK